jgi:hypothetical protein
VYSTFSVQWWKMALQRRESREKLQMYSGKRHVMDSFYSKIKRHMEKLYPDKELCVAYGSAFRSMKANGKGEISAPVGPMYAACKRVFKDKVVVVDEFRSIMMSWKHGTKKEFVYKMMRIENTLERAEDGSNYKKKTWKDVFGHTSEKKHHAFKMRNI